MTGPAGHALATFGESYIATYRKKTRPEMVEQWRIMLYAGSHDEGFEFMTDPSQDVSLLKAFTSAWLKFTSDEVHTVRQLKVTSVIMVRVDADAPPMKDML